MSFLSPVKYAVTWLIWAIQAATTAELTELTRWLKRKIYGAQPIRINIQQTWVDDRGERAYGTSRPIWQKRSLRFFQSSKNCCLYIATPGIARNNRVFGLAGLAHRELRTMSVILINTRCFGDNRGWFSETYSEERWNKFGVNSEFVQDNHSFSANIGTIRGIHFQAPPHAQAKLVRCCRGRIIDYAVDLRAESPTYGNYVEAELSADNGRQLFIPVGFGHAFITLESDSEIIYKVSDYYAPECDGGMRWDCPRIGVDWPLPDAGPTLSDKDARLPDLSQFESPFAYDGRPLELITV